MVNIVILLAYKYCILNFSFQRDNDFYAPSNLLKTTNEFRNKMGFKNICLMFLSFFLCLYFFTPFSLLLFFLFWSFFLLSFYSFMLSSHCFFITSFYYSFFPLFWPFFLGLFFFFPLSFLLSLLCFFIISSSFLSSIFPLSWPFFLSHLSYSPFSLCFFITSSSFLSSIFSLFWHFFLLYSFLNFPFSLFCIFSFVFVKSPHLTMKSFPLNSCLLSRKKDLRLLFNNCWIVLMHIGRRHSCNYPWRLFLTIQTK